MKLPSLILVLASVLFASPVEAACRTAQCKGFQKDFREVVKTANRIYCYWDLKKPETGHDFRAAAKEIARRIDDTTTVTDFYRLMIGWAASFHDGHVNFMLSPIGPKISIPSADLRFDLLAPGTATETLIISDANPKLGLLAGDVVERIGTFTAREAVDETVAMTSGSTERMRRFFGARRIINAVGERINVNGKFTLTGIRHVGAERRPFTAEVPLKSVLVPFAADDFTAEPIVTAEILPDNVGYLRINAFSNTGPALRSAMRKLKDSHSLVIDVRKNGGGDQTGNEVLARLIASEINRYSISPRLSKHLLRAVPSLRNQPKIRGTDFMQWTPNTVAPATEGKFNGKHVAVLTSANCFSACDTFVSALKNYGLARVVGEGTGGGTGSPLIVPLPYTRHGFRYSVVRGQTHRGEWIEGNGTLPDVTVVATPADRAQGIDSPLLRAIEIVRGGSADKSTVDQILRQVGPFRDGQSLSMDPLMQEAATMRLQSRGESL